MVLTIAHFAASLLLCVFLVAFVLSVGDILFCGLWPVLTWLGQHLDALIAATPAARPRRPRRR